jgi:hypothetical protein
MGHETDGLDTQAPRPGVVVTPVVTEVETDTLGLGACDALPRDRPVPRIEEPDDVPRDSAAIATDRAESCVPEDDEEPAKAHILVLRQLYPEKIEWIDATVSSLLQNGISVQQISDIVDEELKKAKPQILEERKNRLAQIRDPKTRKTVVPRSGLERQVMESRNAMDGEKKSPPECLVA